MQNQQRKTSLSEVALAELDGQGPRRERFLRLVCESDYRDGWPAARRRARGRLNQWADPEDPHRLPLDHAATLIRACRGEVSWLADLVLLAEVEKAKARDERRAMKMVRREVGEEEDVG